MSRLEGRGKIASESFAISGHPRCSPLWPWWLWRIGRCQGIRFRVGGWGTGVRSLGFRVGGIGV